MIGQQTKSEQEIKVNKYALMPCSYIFELIKTIKNEKDLRDILINKYKDSKSCMEKDVLPVDYLGTSHIGITNTAKGFFKLLFDNSWIKITDNRVHIKVILIRDKEINFVLVFQVFKKIFISRDYSELIDNLFNSLNDPKTKDKNKMSIKNRIEFCDISIMENIGIFQEYIKDINLDNKELNQFIIINEQPTISKELQEIYKNMGDFVDLKTTYVNIKHQNNNTPVIIRCDISFAKCNQFSKLSLTTTQDSGVIRYMFRNLIKSKDLDIKKTGKMLFWFYYWCYISNIESNICYFVSNEFNAKIQISINKENNILNVTMKVDVLNDNNKISLPEKIINNIIDGIETGICELKLNMEYRVKKDCLYLNSFKKNKISCDISINQSTDTSLTEDNNLDLKEFENKLKEIEEYLKKTVDE